MKCNNCIILVILKRANGLNHYFRNIKNVSFSNAIKKIFLNDILLDVIALLTTFPTTGNNNIENLNLLV